MHLHITYTYYIDDNKINGLCKQPETHSEHYYVRTRELATATFLKFVKMKKKLVNLENETVRPLVNGAKKKDLHAKKYPILKKKASLEGK